MSADSYETLGVCQGKIHRAARKLESFGLLLERQGVDREGFTGLAGLGMSLSELAEQLHGVAHSLDLASIRLHKTGGDSDNRHSTVNSRARVSGHQSSESRAHHSKSR